jgi:hypothetical protein
VTFEVAFHGLLGHHKATADLVADHLLDNAVSGSLRDAEAISYLVDGKHASSGSHLDTSLLPGRVVGIGFRLLTPVHG